MKSSLSTEARIFTRDIEREIKRREKIGAKLLGGRTWRDGAGKLMDSFHRHGSAGACMKSLNKVIDGLSGTVFNERGFWIGGYQKGRTKGMLDLRTCHWDVYPLIGVEDEHGLHVMLNSYWVYKGQGGGVAGVQSAYISQHALGRLHERSKGCWTIEGSMVLAYMASIINQYVATAGLRMVKSQLAFIVENALLIGSLKMTDQGIGRLVPYFDVRTVLEPEWADKETMEQAVFLTNLAVSVLTGKTSFPVSEQEIADQIPFIPRRDDHILKTMRDLKGPRH